MRKGINMRIMHIRVMYNDGEYGMIKDILLDKLIKSGKIIKFYRSGGWAVIGRDPVRGMGGREGGYRRRIYDH